jgi:electron transport complex protein RnfC
MSSAGSTKETIKVWDIHGGIHPPENKSQSNQAAIEVAGIPDELIFPLSQHIGAPATAIVSVGQKVLKGEMIAAAKGFVSVPVHASSSGEVIAIEQRLLPHPSGLSGPCIIIKPDGQDQWLEHSGVDDFTALDKKELITRIREAGIAGMGGAGFPAAVKLSIRDGMSIDTLIINGTECEPYITADDRLMRERADEIIAGTQILQHIIQPSKQTLIGVEDNKPEGIAALQKAAEGTNITIVSFPTKYPSGGEKQLIQILTGKEVPAGGIPAEIGVVCQNLGTTAAIYRAIILGEPLISRITTITGDACQQQKNFEVLLGTPFKYLLEQCGYQSDRCERLVMGGPMMGFTVESDDIPIVKTSNCILAPTTKELPPPPPAQACIRCGGCAEVCPVSLLPQQLFWFSQGKEYDKLEAHHLADCIECGACSYACPSNIPLVQYYRFSKAEIRQQKIDHEQAEHSKIRFEARQLRLEKEDAAREAKRKARREAAQAKAAAGGDAKTDVIQAAIERAKAKKSGGDATGKPAPVTKPVTSTDPAQAAIQRAQAKQAGGGIEAPKDHATLVKEASTAEKRLNSAKEKLQQAEVDGADTVDILKMSVGKMEAKLNKAKEVLEKSVVDTVVEKNGDPAKDAIARAMAKRESFASLSDEERLQEKVNSLKKRVTKAKEKLKTAEAENDPNTAILAETLEKLEAKLIKTQAELKGGA